MDSFAFIEGQGLNTSGSGGFRASEFLFRVRIGNSRVRDSILNSCKSNHLCKLLKESFIERIPMTRKLSKENILLLFPRSVSFKAIVCFLYTLAQSYTTVSHLIFFPLFLVAQVRSLKEKRNHHQSFPRFVCKH